GPKRPGGGGHPEARKESGSTARGARRRAAAGAVVWGGRPGAAIVYPWSRRPHQERMDSPTPGVRPRRRALTYAACMVLAAAAAFVPEHAGLGEAGRRALFILL